jgi:thiol-disulfide isomerase/thioredoxin
MLAVNRTLIGLVGVAAGLASGCGPGLSEAPRAPLASGAAAAEAKNPSAESGDQSAQNAGAFPTNKDCTSAQTSTEPLDPDAVETIAPEHRVPAFDVTTVDCKNLRSGEMIGKRPFVLVFFSSWCKVCERKMPSVRAAAAALGNQVDFIGVSLDEDETWKDVSPFVERHGLAFPIVRGSHYRSFSLGYDPFGSIPVIVVVGRDGVVVDLQVGYSPFDYNRLVGAAALAERTSPAVDTGKGRGP